MRAAQVRKELGLSAVEVYRLGVSGIIRTRPARNGGQILDYNEEDVQAYKMQKSGPWTIPYMILPESMPEDQVKQMMDRMMFFCYSKKYNPLLPVYVDVVVPNAPFFGHHKFKAVIRRALDKKLERLVVSDPDLLTGGNSFLHDSFFYLLEQLGLKEVVVADLNMS